MSVRLFDTRPQNDPLAEDLRAAFDRVLSSGMFILGAETEAFEQACANHLGVQHAIGVSSGTDALLLALMALEVGPGDEVIVPNFTFFASAGCVSRLGATPVFADVCPACFNIAPEEIERRITDRTRVIMPVHLFGQAAEMSAINELAAARGIPVLEDAAQAFGATHHGTAVGGFGTAGAFSFFPTKNFGGFGDGGLVTTNNDSLAAKIKCLRNHGMEPKYYHRHIGGNFRLDALQAALLAVKLPHLPGYHAARQANAVAYQEGLGQIEGSALAEAGEHECASVGQIDGARLILPVAYPQNGHIWNQFTIRVPGNGQRDSLRQHLNARGIGAEIYYPVPLHRQECFAHLPQASESFPVTEGICQECLSLPIYPELTSAERGEVIDAVAEFYAR